MEIKDIIAESIAVKEDLLDRPLELEKIDDVCKEIIASFDNGGKVVLFGNGGSAADAQHIAAELAGKYRLDRPGLPALALTTNTSSITAIANDYSYGSVFQRQVEGMVNASDVVIGISTSGTSENVVEGIAAANSIQGTTIGLTGDSRGDLDSMVDICLKVPSTDTPRIQELHILVGHIISGRVEAELFG